MKNIYVIFAFYVHELLWELPRTMLSYLEDDNPMRHSALEENHIKKRKEKDLYALCIQFGENFGVPLCIGFSNELLFQIREVLPTAFQQISEAYAGGRLYPLYGFAHHTHIALLRTEEITQEIQWNMHLHNYMNVPIPNITACFPKHLISLPRCRVSPGQILIMLFSLI